MHRRAITAAAVRTWFVAWGAAFFLTALLVVPATRPAQAQPQTITVLIESSFQTRAGRFLDELQALLTPEARNEVRFERRVVPTSEITSLLGGAPWEMAILSNATFAGTQSKSAAAAFEIPFIFRNMRSVIALQQSHLGYSGLSSLSEKGVSGLAYVNAGAALVAGRGSAASPDDLKGRKVAVFSSSQRQALQNVGSTPVPLPGADATAALSRGLVDSTVINSGSPASLALLPERGFLVTDSVTAQVGVAITQDAWWDRIPFVYRAMIGDAAIAASQRLDQALVETESSLFSRAKESGVALVTFQAEDASRATRKWISDQPEALRENYSSVYEHLRVMPSPPSPLVPRRGGSVGKFYFATTRDDTSHSNFLYRFGDGRTDVVKCGEIEFSASDPNQRTAAFVGPVTADSIACGSSINNILQSSKRMLIFVHGFNNRFAEAAERAMMLKNALGNDTTVILWSWPSKRDGMTGNYRYDKESVGGIARQSFVRFLRALRPGSEAIPLSILAHSMGSWHTIGALQVLSDETNRPTLQNVVLAAPDVPKDEFLFALRDMSRVASRNTLYACGWDWALMISQDMNAYPRAGTGGDSDIVVNEHIESIDVEAGLSTNHSYVFEPGKVLNDLSSLVLTGADASGRGLLKKSKTPWYYWRFNP